MGYPDVQDGRPRPVQAGTGMPDDPASDGFPGAEPAGYRVAAPPAPASLPGSGNGFGAADPEARPGAYPTGPDGRLGTSRPAGLPGDGQAGMPGGYRSGPGTGGRAGGPGVDGETGGYRSPGAGGRGEGSGGGGQTGPHRAPGFGAGGRTGSHRAPGFGGDDPGGPTEGPGTGSGARSEPPAAPGGAPGRRRASGTSGTAGDKPAPSRGRARGLRGPIRGFPPLPGQANPVYPPGQFSAWNRASTRAAWLGDTGPGAPGEGDAEPGYSALAISDPSADATATQTWAVIDDDQFSSGWPPARAERDWGSHGGDTGPVRRAAADGSGPVAAGPVAAGPRPTGPGSAGSDSAGPGFVGPAPAGPATRATDSRADAPEPQVLPPRRARKDGASRPGRRGRGNPAPPHHTRRAEPAAAAAGRARGTTS